MHKNATKCNETLSKWCKNKHGASKIIDTFETYQNIEWTQFPYNRILSLYRIALASNRKQVGLEIDLIVE
jgi:hypothetical protein